jgi:hypothetical protein
MVHACTQDTCKTGAVLTMIPVFSNVAIAVHHLAVLAALAAFVKAHIHTSADNLLIHCVRMYIHMYLHDVRPNVHKKRIQTESFQLDSRSGCPG